MLICPVRTCQLPLKREARRLVCERGHSFDIARSGYVNLLQPQDKKSKQPGDSAKAVAARRRLHDRGIASQILEGIAETLALSRHDAVLDVGCGDGYYLGSLVEGAGCGVDISIPAIEAAARKYPNCQWVVANADRLIPFADGWFSAAMSITGRMNSRELRRVLRDDGRLLVAIPAPDDLIELRGRGRDRVERTVADFDGEFTVKSRCRAGGIVDLDKAGVEDVLLSIYRPLRSTPAEAMRLTFALDLLLLMPKK